jgi:hypothetical protein
MIWQSPIAWAGLIAVALPIAIHLLTRHRARTLRFPTLRFVPASRLAPARRTKLTDTWLLVLRGAIVVVAVAALAQPLLFAANRAPSGERRGVRRAIVLDTSASMRRATASGERAADVARREARRLENESGTGLVIATATPARALEGAARWLELEGGARELVVVSDFQQGAVDSSDVARVSADIGLRFVPVVPAVRAESLIELKLRAGQRSVQTRVALAGDHTGVEWRDVAAPGPVDDRVTVLAGAREMGAAAVALHAASSAGSLTDAVPDDRRAAVVFASFEGRADLLRDAQAPSEPWMSDAMLRLHHDPLLAALAPASRAVERVAVGTVASRSQLLVFTSVPTGSLAAAALIAAASRAIAPPLTPGELAPDVIGVDLLRRWERPSSVAAPRNRQPAGASDGRWFWLLALGLIATESVVRRQSKKPQ